MIIICFVLHQGGDACCVFPFNYEGIEYNDCTNKDDIYGDYWCAVKTNPDGTYISSNFPSAETWLYCDTNCAPVVDCQWSDWDSWSTCSVTCGSGSQTRTRTELQSVANGGQTCQGSNQESQSCDPGAACPQFTKGKISNQQTGKCIKVPSGRTNNNEMVTCSNAGEWEYDESTKRFKA